MPLLKYSNDLFDVKNNKIWPKIMNSQKIDSIFNGPAKSESNKQLSSKDQKISELKSNRVLKFSWMEKTKLTPNSINKHQEMNSLIASVARF